MPISLDNSLAAETQDTGKAAAWSLFRRKVTVADRMFFTEQLALLVETGESLHGALTLLGAQRSNPELSAVIDALANDVAGGHSFSEALGRHPDVFTPTFVNLVRAGENGGFLQQVLTQILDMDERREKLRATIVSAASYPIFLISFSLAVVIFVLMFVFPKFQTMFVSIADQLPASTRTLMWVSDRLRSDGYAIAGVFFGLGFVIRRWTLSDSGAAFLDRAKLTVPGVRDVYTQLYLVQTMRVLSLSLGNGVNIVDALESCRDAVRNRIYARVIGTMETSVTEGGGLANGLRSSPYVPDVVKQMIQTGEQSGRLSTVMSRIADYYERELEKKLHMLSRLAEPVMLIVMGGVVGVLVSSLILPIFKLSRAVG